MNDRPADNPFKITATPEPEQGRGRPVAEVDPSADPTEAQIDVAKQRKGSTGGITLHWNNEQQLFSNRSKRDEA